MHSTKIPCAVPLFLTLALTSLAHAQKFQANYDESKVPEYTLPDPAADGRRPTGHRGRVARPPPRPRSSACSRSTSTASRPGGPSGWRST